ncbi:MAG TPA: hypothetical protein VFJ19_11850 [Nocardioidaceae bacterium]|nr:hypothetical protein [Nocardioidaceae bacterium]
MSRTQRRPGECWARGDYDYRCTEDAGHRYAHYDASEDVSWTDRTEDHRDGCTCDCCVAKDPS